MAMTLTTELEAVNIILGTIGEAPVNSLLGAVPVDVSQARTVLKEVSKEVQMIGWHFNTDREWQSSLDGNGEVTLAANTLKVDVSPAYDTSSIDPAQRGTRLYDAKAHSYTFSSAPKLDIVYGLEWDELPEAARRYIYIKAARVFQKRYIGSDTIHAFSQDDELEAKMKLEEFDSDTADYSMFSNWSVARILQRRR